MSERLDELKKLSTTLQDIGGVIRIVKANESSPRTYCLEDLQYTKECTIGEVFRAVREYYGKTVEDYGKLWVRFRNDDNTLNNRYQVLNEKFKKCNDLEKIQIACLELQEKEIPVLPLEETRKRLAEYKTK